MGCYLVGAIILIPVALILFFINPMIGAGGVGLAVALAVVGTVGARRATEESPDQAAEDTDPETDLP